MAPVQSIKFQTANFPIFCGRIIVIFCTTWIVREVFSLVVMGNDKQVLPVLHWLEVVIAFVSSLYCLVLCDGIHSEVFTCCCCCQWLLANVHCCLCRSLKLYIRGCVNYAWKTVGSCLTVLGMTCQPSLGWHLKYVSSSVFCSFTVMLGHLGLEGCFWTVCANFLSAGDCW